MHWVLENIQKSLNIKIKDVVLSDNAYYKNNKALILYHQKFVLKSITAKYLSEFTLEDTRNVFDNLILDVERLKKITDAITKNHQKEVKEEQRKQAKIEKEQALIQKQKDKIKTIIEKSKEF